MLYSLEFFTKFYEMFFRVAASVNEMFVYAWLRPALFKSLYLIADRFKLFWKIMSGISTNYVGDLKRMIYMHVFDCFLHALLESVHEQA